MAIALIISTGILSVQPASAQIIELATGALSILNSITGGSEPQPTPQAAPPIAVPQPRPQPSPKFTVGAGNLNGNRLNLCVSNCLPIASPGALSQQLPVAQ